MKTSFKKSPQLELPVNKKVLIILKTIKPIVFYNGFNNFSFENNFCYYSSSLQLFVSILGMLPMGAVSVKYEGARPLTAWCTGRQSLNLILFAFLTSEVHPFIAGVR